MLRFNSLGGQKIFLTAMPRHKTDSEGHTMISKTTNYLGYLVLLQSFNLLLKLGQFAGNDFVSLGVITVSAVPG